ncbi:MAG: cupredoxin domain-containing protein [Demequina sp.]|uniref:cupredoxin domain-containing protein n=1 Tax=Demequina sp. TaxID=2050685 RepID=UPI0019BA9659|nr:cupredoxin domain-containing protein [Demequina sp.]MBC7298593.1 cupredoxin domain-containing protein [Demequina sp.]
MNTTHRWALACLLPVSALAATACTASSSGGDLTVAVSSTDDSCVVAQASAPAGNVVFSVTNDGSQETEFYVYEADGTTIVAEVENVGPGLTRDLVAQLEPGTYVTSCDPGMDGDDIRADFVATDAG